MKEIVAYTDGACIGNPGPGGYGAVLLYEGHRRELSGGFALTTNNRMELLAAISALESLPDATPAELHTDSQYVKDGITKWMNNWKRNGWRTASKEPVKNVDLWKRLDTAAQRHHVSWHWVRGHVGHDENERADELAREGMQPFLRR